MANFRREVIRPDYDPVIITLDRNPDQCTQREGQYGVDYQYIVNNDRGIMWAPKALRDALIQSGARAGDSVEICKSQRGRAVSYVATLVSDAREPRAAAPPVEPETATPQPVSEVHPITELVTACLRSAIDAMCEARIYADKRELDLDGPSWEDVRAIANTLFINRSGGKK